VRGPKRADWLGKIYDRSRPEVQRKLDIVEELTKHANDLDTSLANLSIAFTLAHPAVTSSIIGPRTLEQLEDLLKSADLRLDDAMLDAIDDLVPPGTLVDEEDRGIDGWWLEKPALRRRSPGAPRT
jgi:aryl-alcohol dehydrogenase-like predicted oxidoreductase